MQDDYIAGREPSMEAYRSSELEEDRASMEVRDSAARYVVRRMPRAVAPRAAFE
jgi:hypothetical protein